jgi:hypothetical protein
MYGWRARIGNISPTACAEILPYEFYRVAPEGVTFVSTNLVIRDARESSQGCGEIRVWRGLIVAAHTLYHLPSLPPRNNFARVVLFYSKMSERLRAGARSQTPLRPPLVFSY